MEAHETVKILVVDDQPESLIALEAVLERPGQELICAASAAEALRHVLEEDFAVVLLDVKMPGMDGFETAGLIRERERSRLTPIIFLTAHKSEEQLFRGYYAGAVDYLFKPVVPDVLRSKVAVFVDLYRKTQLLRSNADALEGKNQELETLYRKIKELDELKTSFFANVSHELRTPLSLILGPLEKLRAEGGLTDGQLSDLVVVERNSRTLLKYVNDLLGVARLEAGRAQLDLQECDLARLVAQAAAHFDAFAQNRGISLSVETPPSLPGQMDAAKVERVLLNLLSNAFQFAPDGGSIKCAAREENGRAVITVQDNGPGVPAAMREAIFERFRRGESGGENRFGSTGLGLAIAKEFVDLHSGTIAVSDAPGGGALFTIQLPLSGPSEAAAWSVAIGSVDPGLPQALEQIHALPEAACVDDSLPGGGRALVLVVEDNAEMARFIANSLSGEYRVSCAANGEEALEKALSLRPDLILSDVMMPGMGGERLVHEIRAHPELDAIPIVLLTAKADPELRNSLLRGGAQDYLVKPFSVEELRARARNLVAIKRTRAALEREVETQGQSLEELARELALRKRQEQNARMQAEAAARSKDEFLATVSHELRTPLTAVLGWSRLLRQGELDSDTAARALEAIERNAAAQAKLISDILDVSRIVSGKLRLEVRPVDLGSVIEAALDVVRPAAEAKRISLDLALDPRDSLVAGDPDRLQQVIWNLLSNAVKFTPEGGRVRVHMEQRESQLEVEVTDSGRGIEPEFLPHVFEPFRQADASTTRTHGGLGLGLAIVRHLIELHGGSVHADSQGESRGATFTVKLPLLIASSLARGLAAPEVQHEPCPEPRVNLDGIRVLVVDDDADTREMVTKMLGKFGAHVTAAGSASEALSVLDQVGPHVILSDVEMPGEDGYSLLRRLRGIEGEHGSVPAAALTAHAREEDRARALSAGFQMHVAKPIDPTELAGVVASLSGRAPVSDGVGGNRKSMVATR